MLEARTEPLAGAPSGAAMDRVVRRRRPWLRPLLVAALALAAVVVALVLLRPTSQRSVAVAGSHVTVARVERGKFDDVIQVRGRVTPLRTTYVDTASGGKVEAILVEDGAAVEA